MVGVVDVPQYAINFPVPAPVPAAHSNLHPAAPGADPEAVIFVMPKAPAVSVSAVADPMCAHGNSNKDSYVGINPLAIPVFSLVPAARTPHWMCDSMHRDSQYSSVPHRPPFGSDRARWDAEGADTGKSGLHLHESRVAILPSFATFFAEQQDPVLDGPRLHAIPARRTSATNVPEHKSESATPCGRSLESAFPTHPPSNRESHFPGMSGPAQQDPVVLGK